MSNGYAYMLSEAKSGLPSKVCFQLNDAMSDVPVSRIVHLVRELSRIANSADAAMTISFEKRRGRTFKVSTLDRYIENADEFFSPERGRVEFSVGGTDVIDKLWLPEMYFSFGHRDGLLDVCGYIDSTKCSELIILSEILSMGIFDQFFSSSIFVFPTAFSPKAYLNGLSFDPGQRSLGALSWEEQDRLGRWNQQRRNGRHPSQGYIRDLYPINIIDMRLLVRRIGDATLLDWIKSDERRGTLEQIGKKHLWTVDESAIGLVRSVLDAAEVTLSGF